MGGTSWSMKIGIIIERSSQNYYKIFLDDGSIATVIPCYGTWNSLRKLQSY